MTVAEARKPYKLIAFALALCFGIVSTLCVVSASISLEDADLQCSVKAYYLKYTLSTTWTRGIVLQADGSTIEVESYRLTSDYVSVVPSGTVVIINSSTFAATNILSYCFYDSSYTLLTGGTSASRFLNVPANAAYVRVTQSGSPSYSILSSPSQISSLSDRFIWGELENITISDNVITIPYQVYAFNTFRVYAFFYDDNMPYSSVGVSYKLTYSNSTVNSGLVSFSSNDSFAYAYLDSLSYVPYGQGDVLNEYSDGGLYSSSNKNPAYLWTSTENGNFVGFRLQFPVNGLDGAVSTSIDVELSNFTLDDKSIEAELSVYDALDQLNDLADQLAVPTPYIDVDNLIDTAFNGVDMSTTNNFFSIFYNNDIIPKMLLIAVTVALLGYILFGKKDSG